MPRITQSEIHSDFSTASGTWTGYRAEVTGFYNDYPNSELDAHISREYNRKISNLGQDDSLYLHPYDAGFSYRGDGYNFFDILGNAAAAYSLRSIDPTKDPNVVKVRRSSDNTTKDFKASEIGTLRDWTLGDALSLDGQRMYFQYEDSNYVDLNHSFIPATGDFDISFKYLHNTPDDNNKYIITQGSNVNTFVGVGVNVNGQAAVFVDGTNSGSFGSTFLSVGQIYEMKLTRVGDVFTFYLDGVSLGSQTVVGKVIPTDTNTFFGQATWTNARYITGVVYDIKKDGVLYYKGYGNTDVYWTDQVGSNDATVYGTPSLFSGQGFDGHVTTWYDQGTNGNNATQTTSSAQPKIVDSGTLITEGGKAALSFDGAGDFISIDHSDLYGQVTLDSYYVTSTSDTQYLYPSTSGTSPYGFVADTSTGTGLHSGYGTPTLFVNGAQFNGTNRSDVYNLLNGYKLAVHQGASTTDSRWATQDIRFGDYFNSNSFTYTGKLQEMIFFNTDQSANRVQMENSIMNYYNIS